MDVNLLHSMIHDDRVLLDQKDNLMRYAETHPQVSLVQTLKAKYFQLTDDDSYRLQLKKAAIYSPNRRNLYSYLIQPKIEAQIEAVEEGLEEAKSQSDSPAENKSEEQKILEQEILQHAVSSSILLEVAEASQEDIALKKEEPIIEEKVEDPNFDTYSVLDWLKSDDTPTEPLEEKTSNLIDNFIQKDVRHIKIDDESPTIINIDRPKQEFFSPENMAKMSLMEDENLVTETLARIYADQGNISKAKKTYEKLSLKFPEKSNYFARLIEELDNKQ